MFESLQGMIVMDSWDDYSLLPGTTITSSTAQQGQYESSLNMRNY